MAKISKNQLAVYAVDRLESGVNLDRVARELAGFLLHERRTREASDVLRAIDVEMSKRGRSNVTITSAFPVSSEIKRLLADMLSAQNPKFDEVIDPNVIGGVAARAGEHTIDLTVRTKLNAFKARVTRSE